MEEIRQLEIGHVPTVQLVYFPYSTQWSYGNVAL